MTRYKMVAVYTKHGNSFLKVDRHEDIFENFFKNFWNQVKALARFGILSVRNSHLKKSEVRQAIEDLANGKKTDAVDDFLKKC